MEKRISVTASLLSLAVLVLVLRLLFWQVVKSGEFTHLARAQYLAGEKITARRGDILAADGTLLVTSDVAWQVWADPQKTDKSLLELASILGPLLFKEKFPDATDSAQIDLLKNEEERIKKLLSKKDKRWLLVSDRVEDQTLKEIENLKLSGFGWDRVNSRFYPEASTAAHLLGFVGKDEVGSRGYFGLEGFYDLTLSGKSGFVRQEKDLRGRPIPFGFFSKIPASDGFSLVTYIDRSVQFIVEKHLKSGVEKYGAKSGSVIVMKPTGEVIAMSSFPAYDPARYSQAEQSLLKNPAVANSFEPGSIFKVLVMAGALDSGVVEPDTKCDACTGPVVINKYTIRTYNDVYYPETSMEDVILHSDNTGMVFVARRLGLERLWDYLQKFGIGSPSGIDLEEEASPALRDKDGWSEVDLATSGFGQGVAVTAIQFIRAFAALANGGLLPEPRVVQKLVGDSWEQEIPAGKSGRVISQEAAGKIRDMLVRSIDQGEGVIKWAKPEGFKIAGKSGTAQIPEGGKYTERTVASFVGFAPAYVDKPKFVMLVTLVEPTANPWGANTAGPIWFSIARELFPYFGIQPSN